MPASSPPVKGIAEQWVTDVGHMYPDLVGAAGMQNTAHQTGLFVLIQALECGVRGLAGLTGQVHHTHAQAVARIASDGSLDFTLDRARPASVTNGKVLPADLARGNHAHQRVHGSAGTRHHHQATGVLVQSVHDTGTGQIDDCGVEREQSVEQGALPIAGGWMHHEPRRFVDHAQMVVQINGFNRHVLRHKGAGLRRGSQGDADLLTRTYLDRCLGDHSGVDLYIAGIDTLLEIAARELLHHDRQRFVQPLTVQGRIDPKLPELGLLWTADRFISKLGGPIGCGGGRYNQFQ